MKSNYILFAQEDSPNLEKDKTDGDFDSQREDAIKVSKICSRDCYLLSVYKRRCRLKQRNQIFYFSSQEATKDGSKKVFGGGNKDSIKEAAPRGKYSKDKESSKSTNNGTETSNEKKDPRSSGAMENGEDGSRDDQEGRRGGRRGRGRGRDRKGDRGAHENDDGNGGGAATNVSLFDFFEEKFPDKKFNDKSKNKQDKNNQKNFKF